MRENRKEMGDHPLTIELRPGQMEEVRREALRLKEETRWTRPRIMTGHPVAHARTDKSRAVNFSTVTRLITISENFRVFLLYRYPFSWLHSITDNIHKLQIGKRAAKPFRRRRWQQIVREKSFIPVIPVDVPGVIALPYIPNWNLFDILHHGVVELTADEIRGLLDRVCRKLNEYHGQGKAWGETGVRNIIVKDDGSLEPILCDGEVQYYPWVSLEWRKMSDWFDFIFSACGSLWPPKTDPGELALHLLDRIEDDQVRALLIRQCERGKTVRLRVILQILSGRWDRWGFEAGEATREAIAGE
jgi:hypothetical protein